MAARLLCAFDNVILRHILREFNEEANELAQIASKYKVSPSSLGEFITVKKSFVLFQEREIYCLGQLDPDDWRKPIVDSLKNPNVLVDRKTRYKTLSYVLLNDVLYKKFVDENLLTCLGERKGLLLLS